MCKRLKLYGLLLTAFIRAQLNVLVDDCDNAMLGDFGLSRIKGDATSQMASLSTHEEDAIVGSRNWMAPEVLLGGIARMPADIYAFGMMIYEVKPFPPHRTNFSRILITGAADIHGQPSTLPHPIY